MKQQNDDRLKRKPFSLRRAFPWPRIYQLQVWYPRCKLLFGNNIFAIIAARCYLCWALRAYFWDVDWSLRSVRPVDLSPPWWPWSLSPTFLAIAGPEPPFPPTFRFEAWTIESWDPRSLPRGQQPKKYFCYFVNCEIFRYLIAKRWSALIIFAIVWFYKLRETECCPHTFI